MGPALNFGVYEKVPPARKVPYNPSILIPLGKEWVGETRVRYEEWQGSGRNVEGRRAQLTQRALCARRPTRSSPSLLHTFSNPNMKQR